jgi:hypothetical protein
MNAPSKLARSFIRARADRSLTARLDEHSFTLRVRRARETDSPYARYLPIPTSQSRTIKLNGRPNNHIITYAIGYLLY